MEVPFGVHITLQFIVTLVFIYLYYMTYTYIDRLEKTGCACAQHTYRNFIKNFPLFAIGYLVIMLFVPFLVHRTNDAIFQPIIAIVSMIANVSMLVFFVLAFVYVQDMIQKKCACSEDSRREVLYIWSIFEIVFVALIILKIIYHVLLTGLSFKNLRANVMADAHNVNAVTNTTNAVQKSFSTVKDIKKSVTTRASNVAKSISRMTKSKPGKSRGRR